jgi:sensor histidine kinase YesM
MRPNYFNRYLFILIPLVAILITGIFLISYGPKAAGQPFRYILHGIVMTAGLWLGCMAIVMFLWRKYPWEQAAVRHLLLEILMILTYTIAFSSLLYLLEIRFMDLPKTENLGMEIFVTLLITFFITSIHESVFFYQQWKYNFSRSVRLEKDNIEARYEALRAQINPHFLFNSLNSLTALVEENKAAVDYIQNLSNLLRYMLTSSEKGLVLLRDEISILDKYINLQLTRFPGILNIRVEVDEKYYNYAVPPLALQVLVENTLKHNNISKENPLFIEIKSEKDSITVTNNLQKKEGVLSSGQGLKNLTGRYQFFTSRKPEVIQTNQIFQVVIPLLKVEI